MNRNNSISIINQNTKNSRPPAKKIRKRRKIFKKLISSIEYLNKNFKKKYGFALSNLKYLNRATREFVIHHQEDILKLLNSHFEDDIKNIGAKTLRRIFELLIEHKAIHKRILVYKSKKLNKYIDKLCIYTVAPEAFKIIDEIFPKTEIEKIEEEKRKERDRERYEELKKKWREASENRKKIEEEKKNLYKSGFAKFKQFDKEFDSKMSTLYINSLITTINNKDSIEEFIFKEKNIANFEENLIKRQDKYVKKISKREKEKIEFKKIENFTKINKFLSEKILFKIKKILKDTENPLLTYKFISYFVVNFISSLNGEFRTETVCPFLLYIISIYKNKPHFLRKEAPYKTDFYSLLVKFKFSVLKKYIDPKLGEIVQDTKNPRLIRKIIINASLDYLMYLHNDYFLKDIASFILDIAKRYKDKPHFLREKAPYKTNFYDLVSEFKDNNTQKWKIEAKSKERKFSSHYVELDKESGAKEASSVANSLLEEFIKRSKANKLP